MGQICRGYSELRAICKTGHAGPDCSKARRALEQLTSSLGIIPVFLFEFVVFAEAAIAASRPLLLLYSMFPFIVKDANVVTSVLCVLGLVMCLP